MGRISKLPKWDETNKVFYKGMAAMMRPIAPILYP